MYLHPLERKVLPVVEKESDFSKIVEKSGLKDVEVMRALQWLVHKNLVVLKSDIVEVVKLTELGLKYKESSLPERVLLKTVSKDISINDAMSKSGLSKEEFSAALGILRGRGLIVVDKGIIKVKGVGKILEEDFIKLKFPVDVSSLSAEQKFCLESLCKRGIVEKSISKDYSAFLVEGTKKIIAKGFEEVLEKVTPDMLRSSSWKGKSFRRYDISIPAPRIYPGKRHPVNQAIERVKKIWLEMGFEEIEGSYVDSAFWDLDVLFVPQDHPAREMQDTFFVEGKAKLPDFSSFVKKMHESGAGTLSKGYGGKYSFDVAQQLLLRTHTTILSAHALQGLKVFPRKFFAVGRVFRNETLDWKHLFEFNQMEGIVVDPDANLKHLFGYLTEFYKKMGFEKVRMKPSHFPYTEPSMEVSVFDKRRNEWVELGGSGIFRPEVSRMLLGQEVPVLAWGQGLERVVVDFLKIKDLRDIYKNDFKFLRESPCLQ